MTSLRRWVTRASLLLVTGVGLFSLPSCHSEDESVRRGIEQVVTADETRARGVVSWRLEYEGSSAVDRVKGFGRNAAGVDVVRAEVSIRLTDEAGLGSADRDEVARAMLRAIEVFDVNPLGSEPALSEDEKRSLLTSFADAINANQVGSTASARAGMATSLSREQCSAPDSDPGCTAGGCSSGFAKTGGLRRPWFSGGAIAAASVALAACGVSACGGVASYAAFFGPGAAALVCAAAVIGACGPQFGALALAINQHLCDNGVGTYGLTFDGVQPEVRCSCKAELEDPDAQMQPSNFNTLPEQKCVACPKSTSYDAGKQSCLCGTGKLPNSIDCTSSAGDRNAICCPEGTEWDSERKKCETGTIAKKHLVTVKTMNRDCVSYRGCSDSESEYLSEQLFSYPQGGNFRIDRTLAREDKRQNNEPYDDTRCGISLERHETYDYEYVFYDISVYDETGQLVRSYRHRTYGGPFEEGSWKSGGQQTNHDCSLYTGERSHQVTLFSNVVDGD